MKKFAVSLFTSAFIILFIFVYGCEEDDDNPVSTVNQEQKGIITNGTIVPVNHSQAMGNLFVTDRNGKPISGITSSNVTAELRWGSDNPLDSGTTGIVTVTSNAQSGNNVAAAITMDYSGSMGTERINCMKLGVNLYITGMRYDDITEIIKFASLVQVAREFTNIKDTLKTAVSYYPVNIGTFTALYASIYQGVNDVKLQPPNYIRSVIAFTDGVDNNSAPITRSQTITSALNSGVPVHTVYLNEDSLNEGYRDMKNIADTTGGFNFWIKPNNCLHIGDIYSLISSQLVNSYNITFDWQGTLPPKGTVVRAIITTSYEGYTGSFTRSYIIP